MSDGCQNYDRGQLGPRKPKSEPQVRSSEVVRRKPRKNIYKWMWNMERQARIRVQRRMWKLYDENRKLGGKVWKDIEAAYDDSPNQEE